MRPTAFSKIEQLAIDLSSLSKMYLDRVETFKELHENDWIPEDLYIKTIENELLGIMKDLEDLIISSKGYN